MISDFTAQNRSRTPYNDEDVRTTQQGQALERVQKDGLPVLLSCAPLADLLGVERLREPEVHGDQREQTHDEQPPLAIAP